MMFDSSLLTRLGWNKAWAYQQAARSVNVARVAQDDTFRFQRGDITLSLGWLQILTTLFSR